MLKIIRYLQSVHIFLFVLFGFLEIQAVTIIFNLITPSGFNKNPMAESLMGDNLFLLFSFGVILAPLLETIIFQALPFLIIKSFFRYKKRLYVYIVVTAILFGLTHHYNTLYIVITFLFGIILGFMYYICTLRKENQVIIIALIHAINNLLAFLMLALP